MKKLFLLIMLILAFTTNELKAQSCCPSGYTQVTFDKFYVDSTGTTTTCKIYITYCYLSAPSGFVYVNLCYITLDPTSCPINVASEHFMSWIENEVLQHSGTIHTYPPCSAPPPNSHTYEYTAAVCWGMEDINIEGYPMVRLIPCPAAPGLCYKEYKICFDGTKIIEIFIRAEVIDEGDCDEATTPIFPTLGNTYSCWNSCW